MQANMGSIVDTVLDIISKCFEAFIKPSQTVESNISSDDSPVSEQFYDVFNDDCGICLSELLECISEDGGVIGVREMKCPGSHKFHSDCLKKWLDHSKRGDCPMCRHTFYESVRKDCETNLAHQVQSCPTTRTPVCSVLMMARQI